MNDNRTKAVERAMATLIEVARKHRTITYGQLARAIDYAGPQNIAKLVLVPVYLECIKTGIPSVSVLAVSATTGVPSATRWWDTDKFNFAGWESEKARCYAHDWGL